MTAYKVKRFVHLGINPRGILPIGTHATVEKYLDTAASDWYRYAAQNYVLWTNADVLALARGVTSLPGMSNFYVFVTEFSHAAANGMMAREFWDWFNRSRSQY
ncbi:MAG: hypothetical protein WAM59_13210 [Candidatus Acidiferrales bacterium]